MELTNETKVHHMHVWKSNKKIAGYLDPCTHAHARMHTHTKPQILNPGAEQQWQNHLPAHLGLACWVLYCVAFHLSLPLCFSSATFLPLFTFKKKQFIWPQVWRSMGWSRHQSRSWLWSITSEVHVWKCLHHQGGSQRGRAVTGACPCDPQTSK